MTHPDGMSTSPPTNQAGFEEHPPPPTIAGMGSRCAARAIDLVLVAVPLLLVAAAPSLIAYSTGELGTVNEALRWRFGLDPTTPLWFTVASMHEFVTFPLLYSGYEAAFLGVRGATPGKAVLGIRVVQEKTLRPLHFGFALVRGLIPIGVATSCCGIGGLAVYLSPLFDTSGRQQGWHDKVCRDIVIRTR